MPTLRIGLCLDHKIVSAPHAGRKLAGTDVILFPELVDSGYAALNAGAEPHRIGDALMQQFAGASRSIAPYCIAGSVYLEAPPPARSNTSLTFHEGRLVHRYDKVHLFRPTGDHRYFRPGTHIDTFPASLSRTVVRFGVIICYDLRFPELVRAMALRGLDVLFVPARWPAVRDEAWRTLLKARAIENQIFVVGCNSSGKEGGYSYAFDPFGAEVFSNREGPRGKVHAFSIDLGRIADAKKLHRNLNEAVVLRSTRMPKRVTARRLPS